MKAFHLPLFIFFILSNCDFAYGQQYVFKSNCEPDLGDTVIRNAFNKGCVSPWEASAGKPSIFNNTAILNNTDAIKISRVFNRCTLYNFILKIKSDKPQMSRIELILKSIEGKTDNLFFEANHTNSEETALLLYGYEPGIDFESITISNQSGGPTVILQEFFISTTCQQNQEFSHTNLNGKIQNQGVLTFNNISVNENDKTDILSDESVIIKGETVFASGSEAIVSIGACPTVKGNCEPLKPLPLAIYNFVSPNGDGVNDTFIIEGLEDFPENELTISDLFGKQLFHSNQYKNDWSGSELSKGTYRYQLRLRKGEKLIYGELLLAK